MPVPRRYRQPTGGGAGRDLPPAQPGLSPRLAQDWQILDVDMSGLPCGKKAALATPGYFAKQRNRRGPATGAGPGHALSRDRRRPPLRRQDAAHTSRCCRWWWPPSRRWSWTQRQRQRTLIRIDAGAGSVSDINWLLFRGYHVLAKDYSTNGRDAAGGAGHRLDRRPARSGRQIGLVPVPAGDYHAGQHRRTVTRVAVRCRLGQWAVGRRRRHLHPAPRRGTPLDWPGPGPGHRSPGLRAGLRLSLRSARRRRGDHLQGGQAGLGDHQAQQEALRGATSAWSRWAPSLTTCWSGPSAGCTRTCLASPATGSSGWSAMSSASAGGSNCDADGRVTRIVLNQANRLAHWLLIALRALVSAADVAVQLGAT